jgi:hypothetical protein
MARSGLPAAGPRQRLESDYSIDESTRYHGLNEMSSFAEPMEDSLREADGFKQTGTQVRLQAGLSAVGLAKAGGGGGIRTHGTLSGTPDFESGTIDHSATPPAWRRERRRPEIKRKPKVPGQLKCCGLRRAGQPLRLPEDDGAKKCSNSSATSSGTNGKIAPGSPGSPPRPAPPRPSPR